MANVHINVLIKRLNNFSQQTLGEAAQLCVAQGAAEIQVEHYLLKAMQSPSSDIPTIFRHFGIDAAAFQKGIQQSLERTRSNQSTRPDFSPMLSHWFEDAWNIASLQFGHRNIRSGTLLISLLINPIRYGEDAYMDVVNELPIDALKNNFADIVADSSESDRAQKKSADAELRASDSALSQYTIDFTGRAREGKIDPVFCRDREIRQIIDILGRRRKNNPIAVGEAGVGKTAVVEGLALKIVEGDVPASLADVELYGLDMGLLQAGASVKGEFENRLKQVIEEVQSSPKPIILFIDEAHTLIGAGGAAGGSDAANLLKPALARGELKTIAATTWSEYKKYFEKDPALARRFQLVKLDEPTSDQAVTIIRGLRSAYENSHGVYVTDAGVIAAAELSARYITGRQLPDKAIDVLDTACARVKLSLDTKPRPIDDCERRVATLQRQVDSMQRDIAAGADSNVEKNSATITELQAEIADLNAQAETLNGRWENEQATVQRILELRRALNAANDAAAADEQEASAEVDAAADDAPEADAPEVDASEVDDVVVIDDPEAAAEELKKLRAELVVLQGDEPLIHYEVGPEEIGSVIADWTGIPLGKMIRDEASTVLELGDRLRERIKGQDHAIEAIHRRVQAAKTGLNNPDAPMGVFLLVGPSGVGKTETGLAVADTLFGGERSMVTINMSEFQEKHTVSRLIGSPPGYVGFGEGGVLTEAVRQRPYTVVLLDETEKADLEVMNLFYQVFDKGTLSDGEGREIDFKNTVIFLTSNLGSEAITSYLQNAFTPPEDEEEAKDWTPPDIGVDDIVAHIRPLLSQHFKPALLARMQIVPYLPISADALEGIVRLKLNKLVKQLKDNQDIAFSYTNTIVKAVQGRCTETEVGARAVDHIINDSLLPQISMELLQQMGDGVQPEAVHVDLVDGEFIFAYNEAATAAKQAAKEADEKAEQQVQKQDDESGDKPAEDAAEAA